MIADRIPQQTTANADEIKEVDERIRSLGGILARPVGDQDSEEKARREALRRFVLPALRDTGGLFNHVVHLQEVGRDYCKACTALRTTWDCQVPQER